MAQPITCEDAYECAYCPLVGIDTAVMVDGFPAHPECALAVETLPKRERFQIRAYVALNTKEIDVPAQGSAG